MESFTFKSVDETLVCDHLNESYWQVMSCCTVYYAVQGGSNFSSLWTKLKCVTIQMKAIEQYFHVALFNETLLWPFKWKLLRSAFHVVLFYHPVD